jgi:hypothetical protein
MSNMKMPRVIFLTGALSLLAFVARPCSAATAEEMLSACRSVNTAAVADGKISLPQDFESGECWGAFDVLDTMFRTKNAETRHLFFGVCLPEKTTRTELIAIFIRFMENHPEKYPDDFTMVAVSAVWDSFHCRSSKG